MTEAAEPAPIAKVETNAEYIHRLRAEAKERGDCSVCRARPARPKLLTCAECTAASKTTRANWRKRGKCATCGGKRKHGRKHCAACITRHNARGVRSRKARRDKGLCSCGRERAPNRRQCTECLDRKLESNRKLEGWVVRTQKCSVCGADDHTRRNHDRKVGYMVPEQDPIAEISPSDSTKE